MAGRLAGVRSRLAPIGLLALRGLALFIAVFTIVGLVGEVRGRTSDLSLWWIDLRDVPAAIRLAFLALVAGLLGGWAVLPAPSRRIRRAAAFAALACAVLALRDAWRFYEVLGGNGVRPAIPVPLSAITAVLLGTVGAVAVRPASAGSAQSIRGGLGLGVATAAWAVAFPLAQMVFFGTTDYRRPADVAVVLGARVYATGQASPLLADRIRTGVALVRDGQVPLLIMSGGDGADGFNEAEVMREAAIAGGVDPAAIVVDPAGDSTEATVANVIAILRSRGLEPASERVIAVSQAYHLPRVQLAFENAGVDVLTVPAAEREPIREMPVFIAREVPAFWAYYLRVCLG